MDKPKLLLLLDELAFILEVQGENPFKARAYRRAAQALETLSEAEIERRGEENRLGELPGFGKALAEKVGQFLRQGRIEAHEKALADFPAGLFELRALSGLGPKKIARLWKEAGIVNLGMLERSCRAHSVAKIPGLGVKTEAALLQQIEQYKANQDWHLLWEVRPAATALLQELREMPGMIRVEASGDWRRGSEILRQLEVVAEVADPPRALAALREMAPIEESGGVWRTQWRGFLPLLVYPAAGADFAARLLATTGSAEHLAQLPPPGAGAGGNSEAAIYRRLGLDYIEPELREGREEVAWAAGQRLPRLVTSRQIRGLLHIHSNYSDGELSLSQIAAQAKERGYSYVAICDHSQSASYAGGLKEDDLKRQWEEIDRHNEAEPSLRLFKGIESDINLDGSLDYPDPLLEQFDLVVGSIHAGFSSDPKKMTERVLRALRNPYLSWLGHPTGRLLLSRAPYAIDIERVIEAAGEWQVMIEINAHPLRLDLDWRLHQRAKAAGVLLPISLDAHDAGGLEHLACGVLCARKGGLETEDILNTRSAAELADLLQQQRQRKKKMAR